MRYKRDYSYSHSALTKTTPRSLPVRIEREEEDALLTELKDGLREGCTYKWTHHIQMREPGPKADYWAEKYKGVNQWLETRLKEVIEDLKMEEKLSIVSASVDPQPHVIEGRPQFVATVTMKETAGLTYTLSATTTVKIKEKSKQLVTLGETDSVEGGSEDKASATSPAPTVNGSFMDDSPETAASHTEGGLSAPDGTKDARVSFEEVSLGNSSNEK